MGIPESKVKAAFLYNFAKLCEWPTNVFASASAPLTIGVLGEDPFGVVLDQIVAGHTIHGRKVAIRRFTRVQEVAGCQVLFIANSERERWPTIFAALAGRHLLTVGEAGQFLQSGGIIQLVNRDQAIRFEICPRAAEREQLKLSSRLLALARLVCPPRPEEDR